MQQVVLPDRFYFAGKIKDLMSVLNHNAKKYATLQEMLKARLH